MSVRGNTTFDGLLGFSDDIDQIHDLLSALRRDGVLRLEGKLLNIHVPFEAFDVAQKQLLLGTRGKHEAYVYLSTLLQSTSMRFAPPMKSVSVAVLR